MKDQDKLVVLVRVPDEVQGTVIQAALDESGIRSTLSGVYTAGFRAEAPGDVGVMVNEKDLAVATKILRAIELDTEPVDWSKVDVGEPEA